MAQSRVSKSSVWLVFLLGAALIIHVLLILPAFRDSSRLYLWPDASCFDRIALNIIDGNGFSLSESSPYAPNSTMTPGYPLFLAGIYSIFGHHPYTIVIIQIVLSLALTVGIMWWAYRRFDLRSTIVAGSFLLLNLCFAVYSAQIMTDILFLCFLIPALGLSLNLFEGGKNIGSGVIAGVLFGLSTLTRPIALYFPLLLPFLFITKKPTGKRLGGYGLLLLAHIVIISPWFIRNKVEFGRFFFSTVQSFNLSHIHAAPVKASIDGTSIYQAEAAFEEQATTRFGIPANEAERYIFTGRVALDYLLSHPGRYAILYAGGVAKTFLPMGFAEFLIFYSPELPSIRNITPPVQKAVLSGRFDKVSQIIWNERIRPVGWWFTIYLIAGALTFFLVVTSIIGFVKSRGFKNSFNLLAFISVVYFLGVTGPAGQPRHFLPVLAFFTILANFGLRKRDIVGNYYE